MTKRSSRRDVLLAGLGATAGLALPLAACGRSRAEGFAVTEIADGVVTIAGAGANVVAARGPDGVVMVDGGLAEHAEDLGRVVGDALKDRRAAALVNTHWHPEQTGSNARFGRAGVKIIAHENTRLWLNTEINERWQERVYPPFPLEAQPNDTFYTTKTIPFGDAAIECGYMLQAHTDGDIFVRFPGPNVLVTGGVVSNDGWPVVDWCTGGWIGGMVRGIAALAELADDETVVVPSDGPVLTRADLVAQHTMYDTIWERLRLGAEHGYGIEDVLAEAPTAEWNDERGDPTLFLTLAFKSLWGHVRELRVV